MSDLFPTLGPKAAGAARALPRGIWNATRFCGRGMKKLGRVLLYLLPVLVVIHLAATVITGRMLNREMGRLRESGDLLTVQQIVPAVPAGEPNAADLYEHAFDALRLSEDEESKLWADPPAEEEARLALAREVVAANSRYFDRLDEATRTANCAFPVDWSRAIGGSFDHLASVRASARMLALRAEILAADGRLDEALASCAAIFRIGEHAKMEPMLLGQLVGYAVQDVGVRALEQVLSSGDPSPAACRELLAELAGIDNLTPSVRALRGEVAIWGIPLYDMVRQNAVSIGDLQSGAAFIDEGGKGSGSRPPLTYRILQTALRPLLNLDEISYLDAMESNIKAMGAAWPESQKLTKDMEASVQRLPFYRRIMANMLIPVYGRAVWRRDSSTALLGATEVGLALTAFHAEHGRYPDTLAELESAGSDLPSDPFGGGPLHYRTEGDGFVVWSVGPDMDDDGGRPFDKEAFGRQTFETPEEHEKARMDYDLVFRCER